MHALEISDFRLVARLYQGFKSRFDQRAHAAAQNSLLTKQISFGFFGKRRLDHACASTPDSFCIRESQRFGFAARILMNCQESRRAATLSKNFTHTVSRRLGRDYYHVNIGGRFDSLEVNIEAVRKKQCLACRECWRDGFVI